MGDLVNEAMKVGGVPEGYAEVVVEFYQFKNEGDKVEGRLVNKLMTTVRGNRVGKYTMITGNNKRVTFLGGVHLDELLANVGLGQELLVQYTHKETIEDTGYEMKRFKVFVKSPQ